VEWTEFAWFCIIYVDVDPHSQCLTRNVSVLRGSGTQVPMVLEHDSPPHSYNPHTYHIHIKVSFRWFTSKKEVYVDHAEKKDPLRRSCIFECQKNTGKAHAHTPVIFYLHLYIVTSLPFPKLTTGTHYRNQRSEDCRSFG